VFLGTKSSNSSVSWTKGGLDFDLVRGPPPLGPRRSRNSSRVRGSGRDRSGRRGNLAGKNGVFGGGPLGVSTTVLRGASCGGRCLIGGDEISDGGNIGEGVGVFNGGAPESNHCCLLSLWSLVHLLYSVPL